MEHNKCENLENNSELKLTTFMLFVSLIFPVIVQTVLHANKPHKCFPAHVHVNNNNNHSFICQNKIVFSRTE